MSARPNSSVLQIYIFRDGEYVGTDIFAEREVIVGRDPDEADLVLASSQVSRKHAVITNDGGEVSVKDSGSTNGIFVNSERVEGAQIGRLDEVTIGEFTLKLKVVGRAAAQPEAASVDDAPRTMVDRVPAANPGADPTVAAPSATKKKPVLERSPERAPERTGERAGDRTGDRRGPPDESRKPASSSAPSQSSDLSEFDDVDSDGLGRMPSAPVAEFRKRNEVVDQEKFGEMLSGIGIDGEESKGRGKREPLPESKSKSQRAVERERPARAPDPSPKEKSKSKSKARPAPQREDDEESSEREPDATATNVAMSEMLEAPSGRSHPGEDDIPTGALEEQLGDGFDEPAPASAGASHDDDHDDDHDEDFVAPYSLAEHVLKPETKAPKDPKNALVEVLAIRGDAVHRSALLRPGQTYYIGPDLSRWRRMFARGLPPRIELVKYRRAGDCIVEYPADAGGGVVRNDERTSLRDAGAKQGKRQQRRGTAMMGLRPGEELDVETGDVIYHVRYIRPPAPLVDERTFKERLSPDKWTSRAMGGAAASHLLVALLVTVAIPDETETPVPKEEFVEVTMEPEMKLEEPPPEPPKEEIPPPPEAPPQKVPPSREAAPKKIPKQKLGGTSPAPAGVLGLLNKTGSSAAPGPAAAVAAISNLSAVKSSSSSGFKVSGLIGKLPSSDVAIGGGGGGPLTKGAAALLKGGAGGAGALSGQGQRSVGGLVQKVPQQMRSAGQGTLDRDEIQKVINKNIGQIQRCYERELLKNAGLQGKIQVEWTVAMSGSVKSTRQKFSDMGSTSVVNCILDAIKGWQFPQPKGGEVVVSYPFIFKPIGF